MVKKSTNELPRNQALLPKNKQKMELKATHILKTTDPHTLKITDLIYLDMQHMSMREPSMLSVLTLHYNSNFLEHKKPRGKQIPAFSSL